MFKTPVRDVTEYIVIRTWTRITLAELVANQIFAC